MYNQRRQNRVGALENNVFARYVIKHSALIGGHTGHFSDAVRDKRYIATWFGAGLGTEGVRGISNTLYDAQNIPVLSFNAPLGR